MMSSLMLPVARAVRSSGSGQSSEHIAYPYTARETQMRSWLQKGGNELASAEVEQATLYGPF